MNDAMEGRFAGSAPVLAPMVEEGDDECEPSPPPARKRARRTPGRGGMSEFLTESEMDLLVETEDRNGASLEFHKMTEFSYKCKRLSACLLLLNIPPTFMFLLLYGIFTKQQTG